MKDFISKRKRAFRISVRAKLFLSHLLTVLLVLGTAGSYFYMSAAESLMKGLKERLQASAALISQSIDANELRHITQASAVTDPSYLRNLQTLRMLRRMNPDIAFLYVMRQEGEKIFFVIDSDETDKQAPPGQEYDVILPEMIKGFTGAAVDDIINTDEWGSFLSGYAPIKNGVGEYLVGIDMRADKVRSKKRSLQISAIFSLITSIVLAFFFARYLAARFMAPIRLSIGKCTAITAGRLGERIEAHTNDELDQLITAFNDMSTALYLSEQKQREAFEALRQSRDELQIRVEQRTSDLKQINDKLRYEIAKRISAQNALQEAANTDPLTRLLNRRAMEERLEQEAVRNRRSKSPFVVFMIDLDHFKSVNDTQGHNAGDSILIETSVRIKSMLRGQDSVGRWGGEEFMILLPDTDLEGGLVVGEKICRRIADSPYYFAGKEIRITASFGMAEFTENRGIDGLIRVADQALYDAKNLGRNRIEVARPCYR